MKKRLLSLGIIATMVASMFIGCGGSSNDGAATDSAAPAAEQTADAAAPVTAADDEIIVEMVNYGFDDADLGTVAAEIDKQAREKLGFGVKIMTVPIMDMATKLGLMASAGEQIDVVCTGLLTTPSNLAAEGLIQPITAQVEASDALMSAAGDLIEACKINGEIYCYPGNLYPGTCAAFFYDKDMAAEYGIELPTQVNNIDEITAMLESIYNAGIPGYVTSIGDGVAQEDTQGTEFDALGDESYYTYGVVLDTQNGTEVVNWYDTDAYYKQCKEHQKWVDLGYAVPDSISNGYTTTDSMTQGQVFGFVGRYGSGFSEAYCSTQTGRNCGVVMIGSPLTKTSSTINLSWGVAASSTKVDQAVKFIELLTTDADFANLCSYGIEGTHYVMKDGSSRIIDYPEGKDAMTAGYGAFIGPWGDQSKIYQKAPLDESFYDALNNLGPKGRVSKFMGYTFDTSSVQSEITAVTAVVTKYGPSLSCGVVDADTVIDQFRQELKDAGIEKIIAENQKQLDAWLASK